MNLFKEVRSVVQLLYNIITSLTNISPILLLMGE